MIKMRRTLLINCATLSIFHTLSFHSAVGAPQKVTTTQKSPNTLTPAELLDLQNKKYQSLEAFSRALHLIETNYVDENTANAQLLIEKAIAGVASGLDPHTAYLPPHKLKELASETVGRFGGVGVIITQTKSGLEIVEVVPDSPADRAGIKAGDYIHAIEGVNVTQNNVDDLLNKMRGLPGTKVGIDIVPKANVPAYIEDRKSKNINKANIKNLALKREIIRTSSVHFNQLAPGYLYTRLSVFQEDTGEQLDKALRESEIANSGKLDGVILDLRGNPGGLLDQAVKVADLFIDSGIIVSTVGRDKSKQEVEFATKRTSYPRVPVIVLVNEGSASASEIVAGALQDHERALIMGTTTFGKGSVQSIVPLPNGGGLKLTVARYYTPKGRSIQARGIIPDIILPKDLKKIDPGDRENAERKEADLQGHLEASNLETLSANNPMIEKETKEWPAQIKADREIIMAFTYLRGWNKLGKMPRAAKL